MGTMVIEGVEIPIQGETPTAEEAGRALQALKRIREQRLILAGEQRGLTGGPEAPIPETVTPERATDLRVGGQPSTPAETFNTLVENPAILTGGLLGAEKGAATGGAIAGPPGALVGGLVGGGLGAAGGVAASGAAKIKVFRKEKR